MKSHAVKTEDFENVDLSWCKREVNVKLAASSRDVKKRVRYFMDGVVITRKQLAGNYISISESSVLGDRRFPTRLRFEQEDTKRSLLSKDTRKALVRKASLKVKQEDEMKPPLDDLRVGVYIKKEEAEYPDIVQLWRNPAIKVERKVEAMKLDPETVRSRIEDAGISLIPYPINCSPEILNTRVSRRFMSTTYGGSSQKTFPSISDKFPHNMRDFMYPSGDSQPEVPKLPGAPGLWFNIEYGNHDGCVYRLFTRVQKKSPAEWLYQGQYKLKRSLSLTRDEWVQQKISVRKAWAKDLFQKKWGIPMRIQIYALNHLGRKPTSAEATDIADRQLYKSVQETDIARALTRGDQSLAIYTLQCVGHDVAFQTDIKAKLATYVPTKRNPENANLQKNARKIKRGRIVKNAASDDESDAVLSNDDQDYDTDSDMELE